MIPLNNQILIEPMIEKSAFSRSDKVYAEKGKVLKVGPNSVIKKGDIVHFDGHAASFRKDEQGNDVCLVPLDRIRAKEEYVG